MSSQGVQRRLAAILSADVKGYSLLMADDELATVKTISNYREVMTELIGYYRGRVADTPGDNLMAEFASAVDAVECAVRIQVELAKKSSELPDHRRMMFRIGINVGDVIVKGDEIYGDGVNIAARLEGLANAGGICISGNVYNHVRGKLDLDYEFMGEQVVKNIADPIAAYRVVWKDGGVFLGATREEKARRPLLVRIAFICLLMIILMPVANHFKLNLLSKMWQCRVTLLPNLGNVIVVTISRGGNRKMIAKKGEDMPPPFMENPKIWRRYHATVIKNLQKAEVAAVGFDAWFPPPYDEATRQATKELERALVWAKKKDLPIILGQYQNPQDPELYKEAAWGFISVYKDTTWIDKVMYLTSWDRMDISGVTVEKPSFFVEVLAKKLKLSPKVEENGVRLIGKPIPRRLWLAFAETPFPNIPYHEVYNGWADEKLFSGKIVLIGFDFIDTDYFRVPYSPTDFTPNDKKDSYGMPGVFLFAHAINQVMNGYYHAEINDEWAWPSGGKWSFGLLERLFFLLMETVCTCILLHLVGVLTRKLKSTKLKYWIMATATASLLFGLALMPVLFGLANFLLASAFFIFFSARRSFAN
ncbi:MAG: CHASE2 domain-containing protein [Pseudomonadota bacterium]